MYIYIYIYIINVCVSVREYVCVWKSEPGKRDHHIEQFQVTVTLYKVCVFPPSWGTTSI